MDDRLRSQIYTNLQSRATEELILIWRQRNLDDWEEVTFKIIESILVERLGHLPDLSSEDHPEQDQKLAEQVLERVERYWKTEELDKALKECERAIEIAPEYADVYFCRGMTYEELGQLELAIVDYQTAVQLDPTLKNARNSISIVEREL